MLGWSGRALTWMRPPKNGVGGGRGQAYYLLDELLIAGELQETSRKLIVATQKKIEQAESEDSLFDTLKISQIL